MKRRNRTPMIILALFGILILGTVLFYMNYQYSLQASQTAVETLAVQLHATALATITQ